MIIIEKLNEGDVFLAFKGSITSDLISNVFEVVEAKLDDLSEDFKGSKKGIQCAGGELTELISSH
jgi:hypothetical protein